MEGFKKILVPVDFSETSFNALDTAVALAKKNNAIVEIIYARDTIPELVLSDSPRMRMKDSSQAVMNAYVTAIEQKHQLKPRLIWEEGLPAEAIIRTANKTRPDLIVSGTHGASGYRESFIGSTAYTVIKYVTCPVLTIPSGTKWLNFKKILLPVRPIHGAVKRSELIESISSKNGSLHVLDLSFGNSEDDRHLISITLDELRNKFQGRQVDIQVLRSHGANVAENVLNIVGRSDYDIVVLSPSIDMTNKQLFIGPFSQKIINQSPIPVLTIKRSL